MGPLIILSGPSGSGKSTVVDRLLRESGLPLRQSVSATTRPPRDGERDGVHYHFWTRERFQRELAADGFLECAEVYGHYYGTLRREVDDYRARGVGVILVIDVQGAAQVRQRCPDVVSIFLRAPSPEVLERRLRQRGSEDDASLARRLAAARREESHSSEYQHVIVNEQLDATVAQVCNLLARYFREGECHA